MTESLHRRSDRTPTPHTDDSEFPYLRTHMWDDEKKTTVNGLTTIGNCFDGTIYLTISDEGDRFPPPKDRAHAWLTPAQARDLSKWLADAADIEEKA